MDNLKRKVDNDPDYFDIPEIPQKRSRNDVSEDVTQKYDKIINVFQNEFQKEINYKREEVHKIQQQLLKAQKTLHLLKYVVVKSFYESKELKVSNTNEIPVLPSTSSDSNASLNHQSRIHPAIKKLIGKKPINYEISRTRNKTIPNYGLSSKKNENITIKEDVIENERNISQFSNDNIGTCKVKIKEEKTDDGIPVRNREKSKFTILVGNISKWMPSNSSQDNSTHKWMVYVRGPKENPDITHIVKKVRFFLHPSYQPNDIVDVQDGPFHLSRRGWGEFPIRVQIYFKNSKNKPIDIIHNIKLDRTYTGRQTMGGETLVDVWLYDKDSNEENEAEPENNFKTNFDLIKKEILDDNFSYVDKVSKNINEKILLCTEKSIKDPINKCHIHNCDKINNFIENCVDNIKSLEKIEKDTKSIYEDNCDSEENKISLSSILTPEDVYKISDTPNGLLDNIFDNQISLLNSVGLNEQIVKENTIVFKDIEEDEMIEEQFEDRDVNQIYLEDHCYTKLINMVPIKKEEITKKSKYAIGKNNSSLDVQNLFDKEKYKFNVPLEYLSSISHIVYFLFKHMPLVSDLAKDFNYTCLYPYVAVTLEQYLGWNSAKQFCAEWYRAKQIKRYLQDNKLSGHEQWTVKIILQFGQAHGFSISRREELFCKKVNESGKTIPNKSEQSLDTNTLTELISVKDLLDFKSKLRKTDNDIYDVDILETKNEQPKKTVHKTEATSITLHEEDESHLPLNYIRQTAQQIDINLESEETVDGVCQRSAETVILKAVMCLSEELIRKALANRTIEKRKKNENEEISKTDIFNVLLERKEFSIFLNLGLGKNTNI